MSQQARIEAAREILRPTPVKLGDIPKWFRKHLVAAKRAGRWNNHHAFVCEPYDLSTRDVETFVERLGVPVNWRVLANSWHFPGRTLRIIFWERHVD